MREILIILAVFIAILVLLLIIPLSGAGEITDVSVEGSCTDFVVTVTAQGLADGCWDVKLDLPGRIRVRNSEWKSAFFYVERALCTPEKTVSMSVKADTQQTPLHATAKLRKEGTIIEKDFTINQECPESLPEYWTVIVAVVIVLVFGYGLTWWWRERYKRL